jgi:dTDP-4-amino-4,6-dideoxygalactose transaminase
MPALRGSGGGARMIGVGCVDIGSIEREYVNRVLDSGLLTSGPVMEKFEQDFAMRHGRRYGLMVNSGTDALRIALATLREAEGWAWEDEVIVPALTFIATSNVILQNELTPVFVDVDRETFNIDPDKLEQAITPCTKAIIVVHLFGLPCDMEPILVIAKKYGLKVIEDSCESMGVNYKGRPVGSFSDIACFSTYAAHVITTGVGGLAITDNQDYATLMRSYANHGRDPFFLGFRDSPILNPDRHRNKAEKAEIIDRRFKFDRIGYSSRATQMEAALGLGQLKRLDEIVAQRGNNFTFLATHLQGFPGIRLQEIPNDRDTAAMMFPIVIDDPQISRRDAMVFLESKGVETRPFFNILRQAPYVEIFGNGEGQYPDSKFLSANGFYVGCHQMLAPADLWQIADCVKDCFKTKAKVKA